MWSPILKKSIAFAWLPPLTPKAGAEVWTEIWYPKEKKSSASWRVAPSRPACSSIHRARRR